VTGRFLIVTWDGGGNVHPSIGVGRALGARGHAVRIVGQRTLAARIEAAGCAFRPLPMELEWDPSKGRAWEDQTQRPYARLLMTGWPTAETILAEMEQDPADVLLIDCFLRNGLSAAEATGRPVAALLHVRYRFPTEIQDPKVRMGDFEPTNETRRRLGLAPLSPESGELLRYQLWRRCERVLAVIPREFEDFEGELPPNLHYVGPVLEGDEKEAHWDLPWPPDHPDPLVLIAFSSTYMSHESAINRVLEALQELPVRPLVTLGPGLEPHEVTAPGRAVLRRYLPHALVLPHTSLVVTHGGMGTVMAAFTYGVPMVCMPFGRDQRGNAARVEALGAGRTIAPDATVADIRRTVDQALGSEAIRAGAKRMADIVATYGGVHAAVENLESLLKTRAPR
jgi:MGT family glycosyltransferase